jgi:Family of unknown function (DUF6603)
MSSALAPFVGAFFDALAPLADALGDAAEMQRLMRALGWDLAYTPTTFEDVLQGPLADVASSVSTLVQDGAALHDSLEGGSVDAADVVALLDQCRALIAAIGTMGDLMVATDRSALELPPELQTPESWEAVAAQLPEYLLLEYLEAEQPFITGLLRVIGAVDVDETAGTRQLDVSKLGDFAADPQASLQALYGWGTGSLQHDRITTELAALLGGIGLPVRLSPVRKSLTDAHFGGAAPEHDELDVPLVQGFTAGGSFVDIGFIVLPVPKTPGASIDGLLITNLAWGAASIDLALDDDWTLTASADLDGTGVLGVRIHPDEVVAEGRVGSTEAAIQLVGQPRDESGQPSVWHLVGAADATRVDVAGTDLLLGFSSGSEGPEVRVAASITGLALVIAAGDTDGFMASLLGNDLRAELDLDLEWSSRTGFRVGGAVSLDIAVPLDIPLGPITLRTLELMAASRDGGAAVDAGLTIDAALGPFAATVEGIGLSTSVVPNDDNEGTFGAMDVDVAFLAPTRVGMSLDTEVVSGGGYLDFDADTGRYSGALALRFLSVGIAAMGVVEVDPDSPDWSLFFSISANFPSLPLGFGFFLTGVGGLVCVHRTVDAEALAAALIEGVVDDLLFPEDPVRDAAAILRGVDDLFPNAADNYVFGPVVQIGWGVPTLLSAELGVMLSVPSGELIVLGSLSAELPDPKAALLTLHMDVLGVIDVADATVMVVASLYDSRLLSTLELSGGMAFYARFGSEPYFLLSVGGYHPKFEPPAGLPAAVLDIDRMRAEIKISDDVKITIESYFAVTSNTVQFGASARVEASVKVLLTTYTAKGWLEFNVLLVLTPFAIIADFGGGVAILANDKELLGVTLDLHFEGPKPWHASGTATFKFFGVNVKFKFDVGDKVGGAARTPFNVEREVVAALQEPAAWAALEGTADTASAVSLIEVEQRDETWARPDGTLEVRQTVAPLNRTIDIYGEYTPSGADRFDITSASLDADGAELDVDWTAIDDWFAPAQYDDIGTSKRLSAPSYERMTAGVRFASEHAITTDQTDDAANVRRITPDYKQRIWEGDEVVQKGRRPSHLSPADAIAVSLAPFGQAASRVGVYATTTSPEGVRLPAESLRFDVRSTRYTVVQSSRSVVAGKAMADAGFEARAGLSYRDAVSVEASATATDPSQRQRLRVVPVHAATRDDEGEAA